MIKRKNTNIKILVIAIIVIVLLIIYYIFYKNSSMYKEFEEESKIQELMPYEEETKQENIANRETNKEPKEIIIVHITGEVKVAGVVELENNARVIDAVNKAGGFTENADVDKVNLAYVLSDGVKIYIPSKNDNEQNNTNVKEYITSDSGDNVIMEETKMKETKNTLVNINEATQTELETLPGIGPSIALKIISYREENGKFSSVEDIKNVSGIGENKFNNIRELICI